MLSFRRAKRRVKRGARYLDRKSHNWILGIDTEKLDIRKSNSCPYGQVIGEWTFSEFRFDQRKAERFGFNCQHEDDAVMNAAWHNEIASRLVKMQEELTAPSITPHRFTKKKDDRHVVHS